MLALAWGRVHTIVAERPGLQEIATDLGPALCFPALTGEVAPGDRVLLNVLAAERHLGTGGQHLVVQIADRPTGSGAAPGLHVKLRYTPWQLPVAAAEENALLPEDLDGMPVVAGSLHSQLAPIAAGFKYAAPGARLAYVMTDGGALPAWVSHETARLRRMGLLDAILTTGNAFGGERETVGVASALLVARADGHDAAVVCMGPGVLGTGTPWGHTAIEQAWAVEAAAALGGRPIAAPRIGWADPRARHRGLSHHTETALGRLAVSAALVAIPAGADPRVLQPLADRHALVAVEIDEALQVVRRQLPHLTSMGRGWADEEPLFGAAVAAGVLAGRLVAFREPGADRTP